MLEELSLHQKKLPKIVIFNWKGLHSVVNFAYIGLPIIEQMKNSVAENNGNKREYWYQVLFNFQVIYSLQELFIYAKTVDSHQPLLHNPTRSLINQSHYPVDPMIARSPKYTFCNCSLISTQPSIKRLMTYYIIGDVQGSKPWHGYNSISTHQSLALQIWFCHSVTF